MDVRGIVHVCAWSVRPHDSNLYRHSALADQLVVLEDMMNPGLAALDPARKVPRVPADQAYAQGRHISPKTRTNSLNAMAPANRDAAKKKDTLNAPYVRTPPSTHAIFFFF